MISGELLMRHIVAVHTGDPSVLEVQETDIPEPKPNYVRIKVIVAGVSQPDVLVRQGNYPDPRTPKPPVTPGYDIVGKVDKLGEDVSGFAIGQIVAALVMFGGYTEYICVPATHLVPVPDELKPEEAVCAVLNYLTAYQILKRTVKIKKGQQLFVHGVSGGVGTAFLDLGRLLEIKIYGTASQAKHKFVQDLGGIPIDYKEGNFIERIKDLTNGKGVDAVIDPFAGSHLWKSYRMLQPGGTLVPIGVNFSGKNGFGIFGMLIQSIALFIWMSIIPGKRKFKIYSIPLMRARHPDWHRDDMIELFNWFQQGALKPAIAHQFPFTDARYAHELMEQGSVQGRIILRMD
jgi:NADPH:quinone reductase-like Zn-dependent oxidoreductase